MNNLTMIGRLTKKPEIEMTTTGVPYTRIVLAVDRDYVPAGQERQTDFINCIAWKGTAEFLNKHFDKGNRVAVIGAVHTRNYTDAAGFNRKIWEVQIEKVGFCESKRNTNDDYEAPVEEIEDIVEE